MLCVGARLFVVLAPVQIRLGKLIDGTGIGTEIVLPAHKLVKLIKCFRFRLSESNLLAVDRAIPAFGLLAEIGLTLAWHDLFRVTCIDSCFCLNQ